MAKEHLVITLLSADKPGIVKKLADVISQQHGNWLESRMSKLAGKFAGILKVSVDQNHTHALITELKRLEEYGIQLLIDHTSERSPTDSYQILSFELIGADRTGIISEISQAFSEKNININEIETQSSSMPWSGEPLFQANGLLSLPTTTDTDELLEQLSLIEEKLGIEITLTATL